MMLAAIVATCIAVMLVVGLVKRRTGAALFETALLLILLGLVAIVDIIFRSLFGPTDVGFIIAAAVAIGFALDAIHGLVSPERHQRREEQIRELMRRRRA